MKKILLASTALVCAGLFAAPAFADQGSDTLSHVKEPAGVRLEISGEHSVAFGLTDSDRTSSDATTGSSREYGAKHDTEVVLSGETTLDNGLTVGALVEMAVEDTDGAGDNEQDVRIDERFAYIAGSFGEVRAGADDDARRQLSVVAPEPTKTLSVGDGDLAFKDFAAAILTAGAAANGNFTGENDTVEEVDADAAKLIYFTPSFNGFTFGVSFAPDQDSVGDSGNQAFDSDDAGVTNNNGDVLSLGGRYEGQFQNVGVAASAGYTTNDDPTAGAAGEDETAYALGLNLMFQNWTVGGSYGSFSDVNGAQGDDVTAYDLGVMYATGPYAVGVSYSYGEYEDGEAGNDDFELTTYQISGTYALGQGIDLIAAIQMNEVDSDESGTVGTRDDESTAFVIGTDITF